LQRSVWKWFSYFGKPFPETGKCKGRDRSIPDFEAGALVRLLLHRMVVTVRLVPLFLFIGVATEARDRGGDE